MKELAPTKLIYKYPFSLKDSKFTLLLPKDFKFLAFAFQAETPCIWGEVVDVSLREEFNFQLFGTGQEIPVAATYLTTFSQGPFVFHLYRV